MTARVNAAWVKIERWLAAHASAKLRKLSFPSSPRDIDRWERSFGMKIPDALYVSLMRHDGADGNFGAGFQLPLDIGLARLSSYSSLHSYNCIDLIMAGFGGGRRPRYGWRRPGRVARRGPGRRLERH
ncbi:hypothetical protein [Nonomuraea polychroma]|uniref:hypothetical protein n=1 Tax=Nonomuraea polychroma TaxID=46176 RepID=UPI000FDE4DDB|nr:hypothetical protein [Nonomuraea polychroma]